MRIAFALCLLTSACAGIPGGECHGENWYRLGVNDGSKNATGEAARYETSCGAAFDRAQYQEGFRAGLKSSR